MGKNKYIIVITLLLITIFLSNVIPKVKYAGTHFISKLDMPSSFAKWQGKDVSKILNINTEESKFNFINEALAYQYIDTSGNTLLFIVLDAGNFHHPKVCFTGAGYEIKELDNTEFNLSEQTFKAHTLFTRRGNDTFLSFYWIVIDKKIVNEWIEQKIKQLYFSILNKERVGLMIRIDIPAKEDKIDDAMIIAKQFVYNLNQSLQHDHASYIFGLK